MGYPNRPVDMSDSFKEDGWEYCKYLITDPRSDTYLQRNKEKEEKLKSEGRFRNEVELWTEDDNIQIIR